MRAFAGGIKIAVLWEMVEYNFHFCDKHTRNRRRKCSNEWQNSFYKTICHRDAVWPASLAWRSVETIKTAPHRVQTVRWNVKIHSPANRVFWTKYFSIQRRVGMCVCVRARGNRELFVDAKDKWSRITSLSERSYIISLLCCCCAEKWARACAKKETWGRWLTYIRCTDSEVRLMLCWKLPLSIRLFKFEWKFKAAVLSHMNVFPPSVPVQLGGSVSTLKIGKFTASCRRQMSFVQ